LARRKLNKYVFYGSPLKVEYSPESENEDDIRMKINDRINSVLKRLEALVCKKCFIYIYNFFFMK